MKPFEVNLDATGAQVIVEPVGQLVRLEASHDAYSCGDVRLLPHEARAVAYALLNAADAARFPSGGSE